MFNSKKRGRSETVVERRATLPNKKSILLTTRANENVGAQYAQPAPQFVFNAPQAPSADRMDVAQGERSAIMQRMGYSIPPPPPLMITPYSDYRYRARRVPKKVTSKQAKATVKHFQSQAKKDAARRNAARLRSREVYGASQAYARKLASKASLARARVSMKKGGTAIPKKTLMKAAKKGEKTALRRIQSNRFAFLKKQSKANLLKRMKQHTISELAGCLARM